MTNSTSLLFESIEERIKTLQNMTKFGGSFVQQLAELYYIADMNNKSKLLITWPEIFEKYKPKNWKK